MALPGVLAIRRTKMLSRLIPFSISHLKARSLLTLPKSINLFLSQRCFFFFNLLHSRLFCAACVCMGTCASQHTCGGQTTACRSWLSLLHGMYPRNRTVCLDLSGGFYTLSHLTALVNPFLLKTNEIEAISWQMFYLIFTVGEISAIKTAFVLFPSHSVLLYGWCVHVFRFDLLSLELITEEKNRSFLSQSPLILQSSSFRCGPVKFPQFL